MATAVLSFAVCLGTNELTLKPSHAQSAGTTGTTGRVPAPLKDRQDLGGFRMEGSADVEVVFGDATRFRGHLDRFYAHHDTMDTVRARFSRAVHGALGLLSRTRRGCPSEALASLYAEASSSLDEFRDVGAMLEAEHVVIARLDDYGETGALTPNYRFKVHRARGLYSEALEEYREMRIAFAEELGSELRYRRCNERKLLLLAATQEETETVPEAAAPLGPVTGRTRPKRSTDPGAQEKTRATFFIDNRSCGESLVIHVDGSLTGVVEGGKRGVFQATAGRHLLCLLPASNPALCGSIGTVRNAYLHDGFSFTMNCMNDPAASGSPPAH